MKECGLAIWIVILSLVQAAGADTRAEQLFVQAFSALNGGDYAAAERGFRQVLKLEPGNLGALGNLGVIYSCRHCYSKAIAVYNQALKLNPRDPGCFSISDWYI